MYTESATRKRTATLNAVTGRSASMIVEVVAGVTSVSQGDAASWRRNVVNAWMSTVLPVIQTRTCGFPVDAANDGDLRDQRVADALGLALLGDHRVEAPLLRLHLGEPVLGHPQARALRDEPQQPAPDHDQRGRAGHEQPRVLDARQQAPEVGQRELEARAAGGCLLLLPREKIYFDHAARLSARPTDSIKRGAISSTATDSNTESRTLRRWTGLATSTGTRSRLDSASFRPGTRDPPPIV